MPTQALTLSSTCPIRCIVIGASAGGLDALSQLLPAFPAALPVSVVVVQHFPPVNTSPLETYLANQCQLQHGKVEPEQQLQPGHLYVAPASYHLLIERDHSLSLSIGPQEQYARPSIDVLFETAAEAWQGELMGILLTGANADGARGLAKIQQHGGITVIQNPATAAHPEMPTAALKLITPDYLLDLQQIGALLKKSLPKQTKS